jgi:hypothetical protein
MQQSNDIAGPMILQLPPTTQAPAESLDMWAAGNQSLKRLCVIEGDSWYNYPVPGAIGIDEALRRNFGYAFYRRRYSNFGDTLENMTLGPNWPDVRSAIAASKPKVMLISGGGNDIAGPQFVSYVRHRQLSASPPMPIRQDSLDVLFRESFEPCLRKLSTDVLQASPETLIFMHGYAHAIPDGRFVNLIVTQIGPWLKPSFDVKEWLFGPLTIDGVAGLIDSFNELLADMARTLPNFVYVDLRPVVKSSDWVNELHLSNDGFARCADTIHQSILKRIPTW